MKCLSPASSDTGPLAIAGSSQSPKMARKVARAGHGDISHSSDNEDALADLRVKRERSVYIPSDTRGMPFATRHLVTNGCSRRSECELQDSIYLSELEAGDDARRCRDCWPPHKLPEAMSAAVEAGGDKSESGSDSSSTSAE